MELETAPGTRGNLMMLKVSRLLTNSREACPEEFEYGSNRASEENNCKGIERARHAPDSPDNLGLNRVRRLDNREATGLFQEPVKHD